MSLLATLPDTLHAYDHVSGIYLPVAIGVFAITVLLLAVLLVAGARRTRAGPGSEAIRLESLYAVLLALVAAFLVWVTFGAETPIDRTVAHPSLRVHVTAARWSWSFRYPNGLTVTDVASWHPRPALVPAGVEIEFSGISRDVLHGFWIPRLKFMRQLLPTQVTHFDLRFDRRGYYPGECAVFCGERHSEMHFAVRAVSPAAFRSWLAREGRRT